MASERSSGIKTPTVACLATGFWLERPPLLPRGGAVALLGLLGAAGPIAKVIARRGRSPDPKPVPLVPASLFVLVA